MKKIYQLAIAFCLLATTLCIEAQTVVTIPSANPTGPNVGQSVHRKPFGFRSPHERTALKYTRAEIGMSGNITALAFYCDTVNNPGATPVKIYIKEVTDSTFSSSLVSSEENGATLVFNDTLFPAAFVKDQWTTVVLSTPFPYDGIDNLEIIIETNGAGSAGADPNNLAKGFRYSSTTGNREEWWQTATGTAPPSSTGTPTNTRCNIQITMGLLIPCVAPPTAGNTDANPTAVCANNFTSLTLAGSSSGSGLSYQWISSPDSLTWNSIPGATLESYSTSISGDTYFACVVSCSGLADTSAGVKVIVNPFTNCYCTSGLGGNCSASAIDSVSITGTSLANGLSGCSVGNYTLYPSSGNTTASLTQGQSYSIAAKFTGSVITSMWIDYDHSGTFDGSEWTQVCLTAASGALITANFNVPLNALTGLTGMRIRTRTSNGSNDSTMACYTFATGEVEDYFITIAAASPCVAPPNAGIATASPDSICAGQGFSVSLSGNTSGTGQTFQWISSTDGGTTWATVPGAVSPLLNASATVATWYACIGTCSGQSDTSTIGVVTLKPFYNCYCAAANGAGCTTQTGTTIDSVAITGTTLANGQSGCSASYIAYPAAGNTTADLVDGQTYTINVAMLGNAKCGMWIDYNQDGVFGNSEWTSICTTSVGGVNNAATFTLPMNGASGLTGMRVRSRSTAGALDSTMACTTIGTGETEDYIVNLQNGLGINSSIRNNQLYIFPNPTNGIINIGVAFSAASKINYQVINLNGEVVYAEQGATNGGATTKSMDLSYLSKGIYFVRVITDKEIMIKKVVLQ